ncbi:unnamed protein product [Pieris brassicae]|uniref:Disease resistance R13L4/SHOC-2-like LRR domain-containing protein n=1 Tax=Pieris brassicae TaxID=7116 RepID=A0A9P0XHG3_PIEBR|nr:unnamed protein product [Pieris brassicae]
MECYYTSDSCDSDNREQKTLDLSHRLLDGEAITSELDIIINDKNCAANFETILLYNNRIKVLELSSLRYLYLGGNNIVNIPKDIWKLSSLRILSIAGNKITDVPESVGALKTLQALVLSDNQIEQLPASIANLHQLRSLLIHKNKLKTLPTQIIKLKCLTELSLRDNPLVVRFVSDMAIQPPSLLELAGRTIKLHEVPVRPGDVPLTVIKYLQSANCCVNPKCKGVFFDNHVEHIKFVDFCGRYRIPLLQYLCSSKCITGSWENRETERNPPTHMMQKVLLG